MSEQTVVPPAAPARRERGLGYAVAGGLGVTLAALLVGGAFFIWFVSAQRGPGASDLLPADTQLYVTLAPTLGDLPEPERISGALAESLGISAEQSAALPVRVEGLLGVTIGGDIVTWLGSDMAAAVGGLNPAELRDGDAGQLLLERADVIFIFGSRNDPRAEAFLSEHLAVRASRGERVAEIQAGEVTVYATEGGPPSPIAAVALIEHHIVFANRPELLVEMATRAPGGEASLAGAPGFAGFQEGLSSAAFGGVYSDGSPAAEAARGALRAVILGR